MIQVKVEVAD